METAHRGQEQRDQHEHDAGHGHGEGRDWSNPAWVAEWIERQQAQAEKRRPLFAKIRALIPRGVNEPFRYADLGAGAGDLDELILQRFTGAHARVLDGSEAMLAHASQRLARFGGRVRFVQADLSDPAWATPAGGPFDAILASRAVHHVGGAARIRSFFAEVLSRLSAGGVFINLDYVRLAEPVFRDLGFWAGTDPDAGYEITSPHMELPSSSEEQLAWLHEAGFATAECVYREFQTVILVASRDQIHVPEAPKPSD